MTDLTTTLPEGWHEVPFGPFCQYAAATDLPGRLAAFAPLIGLQPGQLLGNVRVYFLALADMPWLDSLPTGPQPEALTVGRTTYTHVGHLETINAGQLEALLATLTAHDAAPVAAGPELLALLYAPKGQQQTAASIAATARAFATLDMAQAWPALTAFIAASAPFALSFQQYSAARSTLTNLLNQLEASSRPPTASPGFCSKLRSVVATRWLQSARKTLLTS